MENIYICSPGEYIVVWSNEICKNVSINGSLCCVTGIRNAKVLCESIVYDGFSALSVDTTDLIDCCEYHDDEVGDENDDVDDCIEEQQCLTMTYLSESGIAGNIRRYSLLLRTQTMLNTLEFNKNAFFETNEVDSAIQYLQMQLKSCKSKPLFLIGSYFLSQLLLVSGLYTDAVEICSHLLKAEGFQLFANNSAIVQLSLHDRSVLLLLLARIHKNSGNKFQEMEALGQYSELNPSNSCIASRFLLLAQGEQNLNVMLNLEALVSQHPHCVSTSFALAQCYHAIGDTAKCSALLTGIGGEMKLIDSSQTKSEAMVMHTEVARLMITCGIDLRFVVVSLLRAVNIGRQVAPKALSDTSFIRCEVMFKAVAVLGEVLERIGSQSRTCGQPYQGFYRSAHTLYNLCVQSGCNESAGEGGECDINSIRDARDRIAQLL